MEDNEKKFIAIMLFYIILSYVVGPYVYYIYVEKTLAGAGNGFIIGSIVSIVLWYAYGSKQI
jgi:hypothetical protein